MRTRRELRRRIELSRIRLGKKLWWTLKLWWLHSGRPRRLNTAARWMHQIGFFADLASHSLRGRRVLSLLLLFAADTVILYSLVDGFQMSIPERAIWFGIWLKREMLVGPAHQSAAHGWNIDRDYKKTWALVPGLRIGSPIGEWGFILHLISI